MTSLKALLPKYLETDRLTLERFDHTPAQYQCFLDCINSETSQRLVGDYGIRTAADFDQLNQNTRPSPALFSEPIKVDTDVYYIPVIKGGDGRYMGGVSICQRGSHIPPDIGWNFLEEYHGKGYATETAKEVWRFAREELGIKQMMALTGEANAESAGVARKIGLTKRVRIKDDGKDATAYMLPEMELDEGTEISTSGR